MGLNTINLGWQFVTDAHLYTATELPMAAMLMIVLREYPDYRKIRVFFTKYNDWSRLMSTWVNE